MKAIKSYQCRACNKITRDTGEGEADVQLCLECYKDAGAENAASDSGGIVPASVQALRFLTEVVVTGEIVDFQAKTTEAGGFLRAATLSHLRHLFDLSQGEAVSVLDAFATTTPDLLTAMSKVLAAYETLMQTDGAKHVMDPDTGSTYTAGHWAGTRLAGPMKDLEEALSRAFGREQPPYYPLKGRE